MTDNVPVSPTDGPAKRGAAQGTDGGAARPVDPAGLGAGFPACAPVAHA
jgi:hypothetical protein